ncbi:hypothetical protein [Vibrio metschnikovii]|uniref:hypothetical protein n=1 Tax=Vibrio metschnikovii TaxID=28172 RepID=UPI002FCC2200
MRTAINTCLTLLILMMIFLSSLAFATDANCPIGYDMGSRSWDGSIYGDRPYICFQTNRCKARPSDVSLCFTSDTTCVARFLTTGEQCTETESVQSGTIFPGGDIVTPPDGGGSDGGDGGGSDGDDNIDSGGLARSVPRVISLGPNAVSSNLGRAFEALIYNNNQHSNTDRDLYRTWSNRINNSINQSSTVLRPDLHRINDSVNNGLNSVNNNLSRLVSESTQKSILDSIQISNNQDENHYDNFSNVFRYRSYTHPRFHTQMTFIEVLNELMNLQSQSNQSLISQTNSINSQFDRIDNVIRMNSVSSSDINNAASRIDTALRQTLSDQTMSLQPMLGNINQSQFEANNKLSDLITAINDGFQSLSTDSDGDDSGSIVDTSKILHSMDGIGTDLKGIKDALTTKFDERAFVGKVDFDVDGVLYKSSLYNDLFIEREQLENEYEQLLDKVKNMFSFDTSDLNSGEYKDHILDFLAPDGSGRQFSFKSGVFPAFIQQANLIATILLFIAAVIAVRVIMGGSK